MLALSLESASAKIRTGPPVDDPADYALPVWAGELPLRLQAGVPLSDPKLSPEIITPEHLQAYDRQLRI